MDITVIIPTYKPREYLWKCLESLNTQTLPSSRFEIILVLNGCLEPYNSQIKEFIEKHPDLIIHFFHTDVGNVSNARNIGLANAKGNYIAFIDDDDYVSPYYLEKLLDKSNPDTVGLCYPYAFNDSQDDIQLPYSITQEYNKYAHSGKQKSIRIKRLFNGPCMKLIHKDIIGGRRFDMKFKNGEDSLFMFSISDKIKWVDFTTSEAIYYRRFRNNSATTSHHSISYVLNNCIKRFGANSQIYFSGIRRYSLIRYIYTILGLGHTFVYRIITGKV